MSRPSSPGLQFVNFTGVASIGVEPFILPPDTDMMPLIELYFSTTGTLFPYIEYHGFLDTYYQMTSKGIFSVRRSWLGLLNMMFAMVTSTNNWQDPTITAQIRAAKSDTFYRRAMVLSDRQIHHAASLEVGRSLHQPSHIFRTTEPQFSSNVTFDEHVSTGY